MRQHDLLDSLRLDPLAELVALAPLTEAGSATIVRERTSSTADEEFCRACHRASAGNPLYLLELVRALEKESVRPTREAVDQVAAVWPASVARHVQRRVAGHGPEATALAGAMATLGDGSALAHAAKVAGLEPGDAQRLARTLREMEVLAEEDPVRFSHPVVRVALASGLTAARARCAAARGGRGAVRGRRAARADREAPAGADPGRGPADRAAARSRVGRPRARCARPGRDVPRPGRWPSRRATRSWSPSCASWAPPRR